ncbi:LytR C-terminal domain-containing protein [Dietzia cinnamea]|uniref:LytR C-terminal domain-containing protein n=1 Tax=Dietzia cinnamea TaxID=321318 RepID=UPI000D620817|nr:LytR C-terminal domain-containing protein [Dietzia cinnamea]PWD96161.1 hypothetical protein DEQ16_07005 [Dietzia maris]
MSSQSENPQYAPQPGDPNHGDPRYDDAQYGDPRDGGPYDADDPYGPGAGDPDEPSGPPYRAIAMVLLSAVVLAVGIGLVQLFGGDDDEAAPTADEGTSQVEQDGSTGQGADGQPAQGEAGGAEGAPAQGGAPGGQDGAVGAPGEAGGEAQPGDPAAPADPPAAGQPPAQPGAPGPDVTSVPVQIFNNSTVTGLAARTGEALRESGFAVGDVANMPSNRGVVAESTAFYGTGPGEQQAAQAIAAQLGITAKPRPADLAGEAPGVIVIVTQDLDR